MAGKKGVWNWILENLILTSRRKLSGWQLVFAHTVAGFMGLFYFYTSGFGIFSAESHRGVFLGATMMLIYLWYPASKKSPQNRFTVVDLILSIMSLGVGLFFTYNYSLIVTRMGYYTTAEIAIGAVAIVLSLEATRRATGALLPVVGIGALFYAWEGVSRKLGPLFGHVGFDFTRITTFSFTSMEGIFGQVTYVLASYVMPFVIFGAFLNKSGVGKFFIELPYAALGAYPAGTAQVAVVGSALMGTISGSPTANVVASGTFTIPLMKKAGYRPEVAAAVEASASTGGMFTPPVMGAAAFFMVEFTGIPYIEIIKVAAIPAALYFIGIAAMVQIEAAKQGLKGVPREELPVFSNVLKQGWFLLAPLVVIVAYLLKGYSPQIAAFYGSLACVVVSWFTKENKMGPKQLWQALIDAGKDIMGISAVAGTVGIMVGILTLTGLGLNLSAIIVALAQGSLFLTLILSMIAAFIVGLGAPIAATYVILAVIIPPAMQELGVPLLVSHMLLIWYSQMSGLTPPVCLVAYAAAGIAKSDPMKTALQATKYGVFLAIIPFLFVYTPLLLTGSPLENGLAIVTSLFAVISFVFFVHRYFIRKNTLIEQVLFGLGAFLLFTHNLLWNLIGLGIVVLAIVMQLVGRKNKPMTVNVLTGK